MLAVLGDSSAVGLGVERAAETPGVLIAAALAELAERPVRLVRLAVSGAESRDLDAQVDKALAEHPDVALIMIGANDVTTPHAAGGRRCATSPTRCAGWREAGCEVVVGTCPDLGTIRPIAQPLRTFARRWSREMAAAQTVAVVEAGGRTVSLGSVLGPAFASDRALFSVDEFHPSAAGYAAAAAVLLPSVADALGVWPAAADRGLRAHAPRAPSGRSPRPRRGRPAGPAPRCSAPRSPGLGHRPAGAVGAAAPPPPPGDRRRRTGRRSRGGLGRAG